MEIPDINISQIIRDHLKEQRIRIKDLASLLHQPSTSISNLLTRPHITAPKLIAISKALNHNFFQHYLPQTPPNPELQQQKETIAEQEKELTQLKTQLLEMSAENKILKQVAGIKE